MPNIGAPEIILIILVLVLLFGAKKLPDLARGSGRALRIFKSETKGLMDDDEEERERERDKPQTGELLPPKNQSSTSAEETQPQRDQRH